MKITNLYLQRITSKKSPDWVGYILVIEFALEDGSRFPYRAVNINAESVEFLTLTKVIGVPVHE